MPPQTTEVETRDASAVDGTAVRTRKRAVRAAHPAYYVISIVALCLFLGPLAWAALRSFQGSAVEGVRPSWHNLLKLSTQNYTGLLAAGQSSLWHYAANSLLVAVGTVVLCTVVSTLAGYGLARLRFRGASIVFLVLLAPFMVPFQAIITPLFLVLSKLHLTDSLFGLILVYSAFQMPFSVYIMRNSFSAIPKEIEEAAIIDGARTVATLVRVMVPLVVPGIVTVVMYSFLYGWNEFLGALMLITSDDKFTLPVALSNLQSGVYGSINFGRLDAGAVIAMIPSIAVFLGLQRYYVNGLVTGAVKS